jgi:hypothetical protein
MRKAAAEQGADLERYSGLKPEAVLEQRQAAWEERLQALATAAKIDLGGVAAPKSHPDKALLAAAMKQSGSVSNRWLAQRLAMGQPASASQFARRWMLRPAGRARTDALLSRVKA